MWSRCTKPKDISYRNYGGKGVSICDDWTDPMVFYEWSIANGYKKELTLDRIDPDGNYEPSNCQWISRAANTRKVTTDRQKQFNQLKQERDGLLLLVGILIGRGLDGMAHCKQ